MQPPKKIGLLFGMENTFPWALIDAIAALDGGITCEPVSISALRDDEPVPYDLILDRISHEIPFYRTFLKKAVARGTLVVNDPFWFAADDKYFGNVIAMQAGVAVPRTVLLPHKQRPPNTQETSFRNLAFVDWEEIFAYLQFPIFVKPAYGGGWKDVSKVDDRAEFFEAYDRSRDLCMMAQEAIDFTAYFRCYVLGRSRIRIMAYDPREPHERRYVAEPPPLDRSLETRMQRDALALCDALGYDMNTVEFAVSDGVPYAIDFTNPAPDAERTSVGEANFQWVVANLAAVLVERVRNPRPYQITGTWPSRRGPGRPHA